MRAHHGPGALAIEIKVTDPELFARALQLLPRRRVHGAGQTEFGVVGNLQRVVVVARLDHRQHRPEYFFLGDARGWSDVGDYRRLDVVTVAGLLGGPAPADQPALFPADVDIVQNALHGLVIDNRAHGFVLRGIAHGDLVHAFLEALHEHVINLLVDDGARAGRALLTLKAKR